MAVLLLVLLLLVLLLVVAVAGAVAVAVVATGRRNGDDAFRWPFRSALATTCVTEFVNVHGWPNSDSPSSTTDAKY